MTEPNFVKLDLSALSTSTEVIESELLAYGIQVVRMEVGAHSVYPTSPMDWFDLYVPEDRLPEVQAILEKIAQMEDDLPEETGPALEDDDPPLSDQG